MRKTEIRIKGISVFLFIKQEIGERNLKEENRIHGMPPVIPENPQILILGSIPGIQSLEKQQYYGNSRNHFWPIMFHIFDEPIIDDYESRIIWIKQKKIALWDTIGSCIRPGSLDSKITEEQPNDIISLLKQYESIRRIICNGGKSYDVFKKYIGLQEGLHFTDVVKLPSTSPVPGRYTKTFEEKCVIWGNAILLND